MELLSQAYQYLKSTREEFVEDDAMLLAAATAFYASLSIAPMLVLLVWLGGALGGHTQQELTSWLAREVGPQSGETVRMIIRNAGERPSVGTVAGVISIGALIVAATGLFAQLQRAMNTIWDARASDGVMKNWLRRRLYALGAMLLLFVLLVLSVIASATVSGILKTVGESLPGGEWLWWWLNLVMTLLIYTLLFAAVYKVLPDADIPWRHTWCGAGVTAILFEVGKRVLELYFGHSTRWSAYGAAGSMMMLLVWIYYSSIIFFVGAELMNVWAKRHENVDFTSEPSRTGDQ